MLAKTVHTAPGASAGVVKTCDVPWLVMKNAPSWKIGAGLPPGYVKPATGAKGPSALSATSTWPPSHTETTVLDVAGSVKTTAAGFSAATGSGGRDAQSYGPVTVFETPWRVVVGEPSEPAL